MTMMRKSKAYNLHALARASECYPAECILPQSRERHKAINSTGPCYSSICKNREELRQEKWQQIPR